MTTHKRSDNITGISVSIPKDLLELVDSRAAAIGLNRSAYIGLLVRQDLALKDSLTVHETPAPKEVASIAPASAGVRVPTNYPSLQKSRAGRKTSQ